MKFLFTAIVILALAAPVPSRADTNDLAAFLQRGLFEEEANHQYEAAIADYKAAIDHFDHERQLAATAIFRLGECYRKQGRTNEASAQYERLVHEFPDQTQLAQLIQAYLPANAIAATSISGIPDRSLLTDEQKFLLEVKQTVQNSPDLINQQLAAAINQGYISAAEYLLDHGGEVNPSSATGFVPIVVAASRGNEGMVRLLLRHGANIDALDGQRFTAFARAAHQRFIAVCLTLISNKADVNLGATSPIIDAIRQKDEAMVRLLLEHGAALETRGFKDDTALGIAASEHNVSICQLLVEHGANVNATNGNGATPIFHSINEDDFAITEFLVTNHALLNIADHAGESPLVQAMDRPKISIFALLLEHKADPNQIAAMRGYSSLSPLGWAILAGRPDMVSLLLEAGANANAPIPPQLKNNGQIPGGPAGDTLYPNPGANSITWMASPPDGATPLYLTIFWRPNQHTKIVSLLLDHGAEPNIINAEDHLTPLNRAVASDWVDDVELLVKHGADVNKTNGLGAPPLASLRSPRTPEAEKIEAALIAAGADANYNRRGYIWTMGLRGANKTQIFRCQTNSINHYTLLESIAELYRVGGAHGPAYPSPLGSTKGVSFGAYLYNHGTYMHRESLIRFPDFKHVVIRRLAGSTNETILIDAEEILASGDRSRDVPLASGDMVEIGNQEHRVAENWKGLPGFDLVALNRMLTRKVTILTKADTNNLVLEPPIADEHEPDSDEGEPPIPSSKLPAGLRGTGGTISVRSFFLDKVVRDKEVLLNTWDLSKVRLVRNGQTNTFDLTASPAPEVWLEDGDLIEISDPSDLGITAPAQSSQPPQAPSLHRAPPGPPPRKAPGQ